MEGKISEIQTKSDTVESHLKKEREKAKRSNERYKTLQKKSRETSKEQRAKVEELEKEADSLREKLVQHESGGSEMTERLESLRTEKENIEHKMQGMKDTHAKAIATMEENMDAVHNKYSDVESNLKIQTDKLNQAGEEILSLKERLQRSEGDDNIRLQELANEKHDLEVQIEAMKTEYDLKINMLEEMSLEIQNKCDSMESNLSKEREKVKRSIERYKNLQKKSKETSKTQRAKIDKLEKEAESVKGRLLQQESGGGTLTEQLESVRSEKKELEMKLKSIKDEYDEYKTTQKENDDNLNKVLNNEIKLKEESMRQRDEAMEEKEQLKTFQQALQKNIEAMEKNSQNQIDTLKKEINELQENHQASIIVKNEEIKKLKSVIDDLATEHASMADQGGKVGIVSNNNDELRKSNIKEETKDAFNAMQEVLQDQLATLSDMLEPSIDYYEEEKSRSKQLKLATKEGELQRRFKKTLQTLSFLTSGPLTSERRMEIVEELKRAYLRLREEIVNVARKIDVIPSDILQEEEVIRKEQHVKLTALEKQAKELQDALRRADAHEVLVLKEAALAQAQMRNEYEREIARLHTSADYAIKSTSEWTRMQDTNSGKPYYVNRITGISQWEIPAELLTPTTEKDMLVDENKELNIEIESLRRILSEEREAKTESVEKVVTLERHIRDMEKKHLMEIKRTAAETRKMAVDDLRNSSMKVDTLNRKLQDLENKHTMEIEKLRTSHVLSLEELRSEANREKDTAIRSLKSSMNASNAGNISVSSAIETPLRNTNVKSSWSSRSSSFKPHLARERAKLLAAKIMRTRKSSGK